MKSTRQPGKPVLPRVEDMEDGMVLYLRNYHAELESLFRKHQEFSQADRWHVLVKKYDREIAKRGIECKSTTVGTDPAGASGTNSTSASTAE